MNGCPGRWIRVLLLLPAIAAQIALVGCGSTPLPSHPLAPLTVVPGDGTPQEALRLLEWCWNHKDPARYRFLFTDDYRFTFSALDPYGNDYQTNPWTREDEMIFAQHFFRGGHAVKPAAASVTLILDRSFLVRDDLRPGKDPGWYKLIRTDLTLAVIDSAGDATNITGFANFFLVRGDSAVVPADILPLGYGADSTHWYIEGWQDDTAPPPGAQAMPTKGVTLGQLKALYR